MKNHKHKIISLIAGCLALPLLWFSVSVYNAHRGFSDVSAWFVGDSEKQLTLLELGTKGMVIMITNAIVLRDLNSGIKNKQYSPGPGGFEHTTLRGQINAGYFGEINIGCSQDSRTVTIGIPTDYSIRAEFHFASVEVGDDAAKILYEAIRNANSAAR